MLLGKTRLTPQQFFLIYGAVLVGLALLYLGITGRLNWIFGLLGAALPFLVRGIQMFFHFASLRALLRRFRNWKTAQGGPGGQTSSVDTRYFRMTLDHDSGSMDGEILEGPHAGSRLSALDLMQLEALLGAVHDDPESVQVLRAYLDRNHSGWDGGPTDDGNREAKPTSGNLDVREALEVLGLDDDATEEDVIEAHRRLMQKMHPDRGGSTYLAARINDAKAVLLAHLGKQSPS